MSQERLIAHLSLVSKSLKAPFSYSDKESDSNVNSLNYLYLATFIERTQVHRAERSEGYFGGNLGLSYQ